MEKTGKECRLIDMEIISFIFAHIPVLKKTEAVPEKVKILNRDQFSVYHAEREPVISN